jgi:hypothetical protein
MITKNIFTFNSIMFMNRFLLLIFVLLFGSLTVGCTGKIHEVKGSVTLDGQPIDSGYIIFFGNSGKGAEGGARIADGTSGFKLSG